MMRPSNDIDVVWLCRAAVDFRKGINGLSILAEEQLTRDPFSGHLFVFREQPPLLRACMNRSALSGRIICLVMF